MTGRSDDRIARAHAHLAALKRNLPKHEVPETYVAEYHQALEHLEASGYDMAEFKIPQSKIRFRVVSGNYLTGAVNYADERSVEESYFLIKLDAVLEYFSHSGQHVDFNAPRRS